MQSGPNCGAGVEFSQIKSVAEFSGQSLVGRHNKAFGDIVEMLDWDVRESGGHAESLTK